MIRLRRIMGLQYSARARHDREKAPRLVGLLPLARKTSSIMFKRMSRGNFHGGWSFLCVLNNIVNRLRCFMCDRLGRRGGGRTPELPDLYQDSVAQPAINHIIQKRSQ